MDGLTPSPFMGPEPGPDVDFMEEFSKLCDKHELRHWFLAYGMPLDKDNSVFGGGMSKEICEGLQNSVIGGLQFMEQRLDEERD